LPEGASVVAEGWGLRPELLAPHLDDARRAVFLVPSEDFRQKQIEALPRAARLGAQVSDPERGQQNRLARDRLLAAEVVDSAAHLGMRVIAVDGSRDLQAVVGLVEEQFRPFLPNWIY
jgi:hypothetical protein